MIKNSYTRYNFIFISILFSFLILLNYTFKIPNDGVLYLSSAKFLLENNALIDVTRTIDENVRAFPTTQIGSTLILSVLLFFFKFFWIAVYIIILTLIWTSLLKKLYRFSYDNIINKKIYSIILPLLIFFNYDYLISASSFYNEAFYYPCLIFSFLKINNYIKKDRNFFDKSILFSIFLCIGIIFRIQHIVFLSAFAIYLLIQKKYKDFLIVAFIGIINIVILIFINQYLSGFEISKFAVNETGNNVLSYFKVFFSSFYNSNINLELDNSNLLFKNIKVHLALYSNFLNIPKIVDITLPNNLSKLDELIYFAFSFLVIFFLIRYFLKFKLSKFKVFLLIYLIFTSVFLFFLTDLISRYFLFTNFCIIYFLIDYFKNKKFKISTTTRYSISIVFFVSILLLYGSSYFFNYKKNTYSLLKELNEFKLNRKSFFSENEIFITRYRYHVKWILNKPSINVRNFNNHYTFDTNKRYFFIGKKEEFYDPEFYSTFKNVKNLEYYLYNNVEQESALIWRINLK